MPSAQARFVSQRQLQFAVANNSATLTVEQLAGHLGMSARHFTRVCLKEAKMNTEQFVDRMRIEAARQMIDSSNMALKGIADAS